MHPFREDQGPEAMQLSDEVKCFSGQNGAIFFQLLVMAVSIDWLAFAGTIFVG